jgi:glyoxylase-like metal-dependent hydrolase (beta-lactamase superfamily II)
MHIGEIELVPLVDGDCALPPAFYQGIDIEAHGLVGDDGKVHIPIGCYLVRTGDRTVLLDAGLGPRSNSWATGGQLPDALRAVGCEPADIDTVVLTHLHIDHIGWVVHEGAPFFPNATVRYGAGDWEGFVDAEDANEVTVEAMHTLRDEDRLAPIEGDMVSLAPGITARHTPGHTLGSYSLVLASGEQRAYLLGDAVECPLQVSEPDLYVISDVDPALAKRTREAIWREVEGTATRVGAAHFAELAFGRVLAGEGKRWFS